MKDFEHQGWPDADTVNLHKRREELRSKLKLDTDSDISCTDPSGPLQDRCTARSELQR